MIIDPISKYAHVIVLSRKFSAIILAQAFVIEICRLHEIPKIIVFDRDLIFMSKFCQELFRFSDTILCHNSAYHPQIDGQTKVTNRTLEQYLYTFVMEKPSQ